MKRLNVFQSLMRHWERLGSYNAAQAMILRADVGAMSLEASLTRAFREAGVGNLRVDGDRYELFPPEQTVPVRRGYVGGSLESHLADGLNQPFDDRQLPFRPFVVEEPGHVVAGIVYRHWVADSVSIRSLMRRWLTLAIEPHAVPEPPAPPLPGGYWHCAGPKHRAWSLLQGALDQARLSWELKRVRRLAGELSGSPSWSFRLLRLPEGTPARLRSAARSLGATVNDLLLACAARTVGELLPLDRVRSRPKLALGTIVDLRRSCGIDDAPFGLLLGFMQSVWRADELVDLTRAVRAAARCSTLARQRWHAQSCQLRMAIGLQLFRRWSVGKMVRFYRKRLPLAGGISNVNLDGSWVAARYPGVVLDYLRVSPTGPMMPLVFTPTTLRERMNVGFTWQRQCLGDETAARIAAAFVARIDEALRETQARA